MNEKNKELLDKKLSSHDIEAYEDKLKKKKHFCETRLNTRLRKEIKM